MTTGYSPFPQGHDATTAADRFASSYDLERIAAARPDLHAILAANPSIPPQVRAVLERSDDVVVQEVLARQAGRGAPLAGPPIPQAQPAQAQALEQIDAMAPTMAVGTAGAQPSQGTSTQATAPQGYGTTAAQSQQSPLPQDPSQADQQVALPPSAQIHSSPSMQSAAQPMGQWPAMPPGVRAGMPSGHVLGHGQVATTAHGARCTCRRHSLRRGGASRYSRWFCRLSCLWPVAAWRPGTSVGERRLFKLSGHCPLELLEQGSRPGMERRRPCQPGAVCCRRSFPHIQQD